MRERIADVSQSEQEKMPYPNRKIPFKTLV